jgi:hypothetical protein
MFSYLSHEAIGYACYISYPMVVLKLKKLCLVSGWGCHWLWPRCCYGFARGDGAAGLMPNLPCQFSAQSVSCVCCCDAVNTELVSLLGFFFGAFTVHACVMH